MSRPARPAGRRRGGGEPARAARSGPHWAAGPLGIAAAAILIALHVALGAWGIARDSVTFDENFHLPSGIAAVTSGDLMVSPVNPPLVKSLQALAALAAGARVPAAPDWSAHGQFEAGRAFASANADRYQRVYGAARAVTLALSVLLALLVMAIARALHGPAAGLLALALYALTPEALAHAGLATLDTATALGFLATVAAGWRFARTGGPRWWWLTAGALSFALLTRFTALLLPPLLVVLAGLALWRRPGPHVRRVALGLAALLPVALLALAIGYRGQVSFAPLHTLPFESERFRSLAHALPGLRLPLPDAWLAGLDHQAFDGQAGRTPTYLSGRVLDHAVPWYFPIAIGLKWPLALLGLLAAGLASLFLRDLRPRRAEFAMLVPPAAFVIASMALVQINAGVRYMLPVLPFACVLAARVVRPGPWATARGWAVVGAVVTLAAGTLDVAPWYLTAFNRLAGPVERQDRVLNDSNVDWGQGLLALRDELRARGIRRVHLAYHGTTDPAVYGIDYVPYLGGAPGPESDWIAVSSYYRVGMSQRMVTPGGRTDFLRFDMSAFDALTPAARPARCMYLYRIR